MRKINSIGCFIFILILAAMAINEKANSQDFKEVGIYYSDNVIQKNNPAFASINEFQNLTLTIPAESQIIVSLHELNGNLIKVLKYEYMNAGKYEISLKDQIPAGNYLCKVSSGYFEETLNFIIQ